MDPIEFPEANTCYGKEQQDQYKPLPAYLRVESVQMVCCWRLSLWERLRLLWTGKLWHTVYTGMRPLQPQMLSTVTPFVPVKAQPQACDCPAYAYCEKCAPALCLPQGKLPACQCNDRSGRVCWQHDRIKRTEAPNQ